MPKKTRSFSIEEKSGEKFPDLETALHAALPSISANLVDTMRRLLAEGWLINDNGRIIPNPERINEDEL